MKSIIKFLIISLALLFAFYIIGNTTTVRAEDRVKTLQSEVDRLSTKYKVATTTVNAIIKCESELYGDAIHHNINKEGKIWSTDWGYLQINDYWHEKTMTNLGKDIHDKWDALEYGFMLISKKGLSPWNASKKCWLKLI